MSITALVLGFLAWPCCCGIITGIPAIVVGLIENGRINRGESSSKGKVFAILGIVLGVISVVTGCLSAIWILFFGGLNVLQGLINH